MGSSPSHTSTSTGPWSSSSPSPINTIAIPTPSTVSTTTVVASPTPLPPPKAPPISIPWLQGPKWASVKKKEEERFILTSKHSVPLPSHAYYNSTEPTSYTEASKHEVWRKAMLKELSTLQRQGTWSLVPFSPSMHLVGCRWVFKLKHNSDDSIARHKACLVSKGFHQADNNETFSSVVKHTTIKVVLALAVHFCWPLHQLDVTNAHGLKNRPSPSRLRLSTYRVGSHGSRIQIM